MLTEECKQYIARYLGEKVDDKYCFTDSTAKKVRYWDAQNNELLGSTLDAVTVIAIFGGYSYEDPINKTGKITADTLKEKNGGNALTNDDIVWIANHSDGENKYCFTPAAPPPEEEVPSEEEEKGYLTVTGTEDADIFLDGVHIGKVPLIKYELEPGEYNIRVTKMGYKEYRDTIIIRGGEETIVNATLEEKPVPEGLGRVCIISDPPFAWIIIDGEKKWKQTNAPDEPPECFDLTPTDHTIRLEKEGYKPYETRITVRSGQTGMTEDDGLIIAKLEPLPEKERKIEVRVIEKGLSGDVLLDYSWIPGEVIRGATTRFRFYVTNDGGVPAKYQVCLEFEHAETGTKLEPFCSAPIEESPVINPGTGQSYIVPVLIPKTAPLGTYYIYVELWAEKVE